MKTTIDRAGRVIIPAAIRTRMGLTAGTELEVVIDDTDVRLVRTAPGPKLERVGKRLVARPRAAAGKRAKVDIAKLIERERNRWPW